MEKIQPQDYRVKILKHLSLIADLPFLYLPLRMQYRFRRGFSVFIDELIRELGDLKGGQIGRQALYLKEMLNAKEFPELEFALGLKNNFESGAAVKPWLYKDLIATIDGIIERDRAQVQAEKAASGQASSMSAEEVRQHDANVIGQMQFYALDYFLFVYKRLKEAAPEDKTAIIREKAKDMPGLLEDVLAEDMLKKIAYTVIDRATREKMITDFYRLKAILLPFRSDEVSGGALDWAEMGLRDYCRSLLEICREYGLDKISQGFHFPYGEGASCGEITKRL